MTSYNNIESLGSVQESPVVPGHLPGVEALGHLEAMFALPDVGVTILSVHLFGTGARASVRLDLSNGEQMIFDSVRDMTKPAVLRAELVACTGSTAKISGDQAVRAVALVRSAAERHKASTEDEIAAFWGLSYLSGARIVDVDFNDQGERWGAFDLLEGTDPWRAVRSEDGGSLASHGIVLRDRDGIRYVRCGWFQSHARAEDGTIGPHTLALRMARVGWTRRGSRGNVKATSPRTGETRVLAFWTVPAGWEATWDAS